MLQIAASMRSHLLSPRYYRHTEAEAILNCLPKDETLRTLCDREILIMMVIDGLRRVEIYRSS